MGIIWLANKSGELEDELAGMTGDILSSIDK
jgi:hypothetical protein